MCYAVDKEQVVAGFINRNADGTEFTLQDVYDFISHMWNAGVGPIRLNFKRREMDHYLDACRGICLDRIGDTYTINKSYLSDHMTPEEREFLGDDKERAKSFDLFCRLQVDMRTPRDLLDVMGFRYIHTGR